jgi:hypothetical protein
MDDVNPADALAKPENLYSDDRYMVPLVRFELRDAEGPIAGNGPFSG